MLSLKPSLMFSFIYVALEGTLWRIKSTSLVLNSSEPPNRLDLLLCVKQYSFYICPKSTIPIEELWYTGHDDTAIRFSEKYWSIVIARCTLYSGLLSDARASSATMLSMFTSRISAGLSLEILNNIHTGANLVIVECCRNERHLCAIYISFKQWK